MTPLNYQDLIEQFGGKTEIDVNTYPRCLFQEGYEQAEKDIIDKIRQEIERLKKCSKSSKKEWIDEGYNQNAFAEDCRIKSFDKLLAFIDSLPEENLSYVTDSPGDPGHPGEPGISDLEQAAARYERENRQSVLSSVDIVNAFIEGAKWMEGRK